MRTVRYVLQISSLQYISRSAGSPLKTNCKVVIVINILVLTCRVTCTVSNFSNFVKQSYPRLMHAEISKACAIRSMFKEFDRKRAISGTNVNFPSFCHAGFR